MRWILFALGCLLVAGCCRVDRPRSFHIVEVEHDEERAMQMVALLDDSAEELGGWSAFAETAGRYAASVRLRRAVTDA